MNKVITIKVPAIVSESVWNMAQSQLKSHKKVRPPRKNQWLLQGLITCGLCGLSYQGQYRRSTRCYACRGRLKVSHTDGSPRCIVPTLDADSLENEVWVKIADILNSPDKLTEVIKDSLKNLKARQANLDYLIKPIDEKLAEIANKKAKLADDWVISNMALDKYKELQTNLSKEEIRLKSLRASIDPSQLAELESDNETLQYWQDRLQSVDIATGNDGSALKLVEKSKPTIKIAGFDDINLKESVPSLILKRQVMDKLQVKIVVLNDRVEISCQIPVENSRPINAVLTLGLQ